MLNLATSANLSFCPDTLGVLYHVHEDIVTHEIVELTCFSYIAIN